MFDSVPIQLAIVFVILLLLIFGTVLIFFSPKTRKERYHYAKREYLFDKYEKEFYLVLREALRETDLVVFPKVRMGDFIKVRSMSDNSLWWKENNKILRKHIDFLICNEYYFNPLAVIELDGYSHTKQKNKKIDNFKDEACKVAGIPMIRVPIQSGYNKEDLKSTVLKYSRSN